MSQHISVYPVYPPEPVSPYIARVGAMAPREGEPPCGAWRLHHVAPPCVPMAARGASHHEQSHSWGEAHGG